MRFVFGATALGDVILSTMSSVWFDWKCRSGVCIVLVTRKHYTPDTMILLMLYGCIRPFHETMYIHFAILTRVPKILYGRIQFEMASASPKTEFSISI